MTSLSSNPDIHVLKCFASFSALNNLQLTRLAQAVEIEQAPAGHTLIKRGSLESFGLYLIEGRLRLKNISGEIVDVRSGDPQALEPIAQGLPRQCDVISVTPVRFLRITNAVLRDVVTGGRERQGLMRDPGLVGEDALKSGSLRERIIGRFRMDLEKDRVKLPSLPEVAVQVGKALRDEISDAALIAEIIQADPAITAKLIKAANSAMYGRCTPVETCQSAVIRLGTDITHKLVLSFAMRELFRSKSGALHQRMRDLWKHSTHVAAICYVLARQDPRFHPEQAMLVGLLHDIGVVAVIQYLEDMAEKELSPNVIDAVIAGLRAQTGSMLLRSWGFPIEFIVAATECEDWMRDKEPAPDHCDLVLIAQLQSYAGTERAEALPSMDQTPAYAHLGLGELIADKGLKIINEAQDLVAHAQSLLDI